MSLKRSAGRLTVCEVTESNLPAVLPYEVSNPNSTMEEADLFVAQVTVAVWVVTSLISILEITGGVELEAPVPNVNPLPPLFAVPMLPAASVDFTL